MPNTKSDAGVSKITVHSNSRDYLVANAKSSENSHASLWKRWRRCRPTSYKGCWNRRDDHPALEYEVRPVSSRITSTSIFIWTYFTSKDHMNTTSDADVSKIQIHSNSRDDLVADAKNSGGSHGSLWRRCRNQGFRVCLDPRDYHSAREHRARPVSSKHHVYIFFT